MKSLLVISLLAVSSYVGAQTDRVSVCDVARAIGTLQGGSLASVDVNADGRSDVADVRSLADFVLSTAVTGRLAGHDYVDLGLPSGTLWATVNIGAESAEQYGSYFAWGETSPKSTYDWTNYAFSDGSSSAAMTTYTATDGLTQLQPQHDAASQLWGAGWRMPTDAQAIELRDESLCTWTPHTLNGVDGYMVTSKSNGRSIFFPYSGYVKVDCLYLSGVAGHYWTSTLNNTTTARSMVVHTSGFAMSNLRCHGRCIRPVACFSFSLAR